MSKKRIYDLAKEYGMAGKDLATKLKDMGFSQVKSHMTALDDFEVLEVQAKLEAYGVSRGRSFFHQPLLPRMTPSGPEE